MQEQSAQQYRRPRSALAGVKHQLYHPRLPTLRRMDMDTTLHRLTSEHSRQTTSCSKEEFTNCRTTIPRTRLVLHCKNILSASTQNAVQNYHPLQQQQQASSNHHYTVKWSQILQSLKESSKETTAVPDDIQGLAPRRRHPDITSSWQHALDVRETLQQHHQPTCGGRRKGARPTTPKPMPATMYSRYRSSSRPSSAYPWH